MYKKQNSLGTPVHRTNPFDSDSDSEVPSKPSRAQSVPVKRTDQSVQELEDYTITKARETTHKVKDCVRAAEAIREDATQTLKTLHRQGEQIARSHHLAADIERDLTVVSSLPADIG
jgi:synaptosomal-associated protein 25